MTLSCWCTAKAEHERHRTTVRISGQACAGPAACSRGSLCCPTCAVLWTAVAARCKSAVVKTAAAMSRACPSCWGRCSQDAWPGLPNLSRSHCARHPGVQVCKAQPHSGIPVLWPAPWPARVSVDRPHGRWHASCIHLLWGGKSTATDSTSTCAACMSMPSSIPTLPDHAINFLHS